ncbi:MAG: M56 family metallopeptidase, partial [Muribaculaceae bacterium]|nr:M56 family metallopeptidase [Muribaculaceae bacterium]
QFLSYSLVSGICLLSMFLAYKLFLAGENQHRYNRAILMAIYFVSFAAVPAAALIQRFTAPAVVQTLAVSDLDINLAVADPVSQPLWPTLLLWIFIAGMLVVVVKTLITWVRILSVIRAGQKIRRDGYTFVLTDNGRFAPFSWMRYIVISRADYDSNGSAIMAHELKHIQSSHWIDLLIAQLVCIVNWFNPAAWLMRDELLLVHEYQADMAVMEQGYNVTDYQMLLIKKAVGARFPSLANSLNHSKLKKRITMMYKEKSGAGPKAKALALVPMLALSLGIVAVPAVSAAVSTISAGSVTVSKGNENSSQNEASPAGFKIVNINRDGNVTTVMLRGDNLGVIISESLMSQSRPTIPPVRPLQCNVTWSTVLPPSVPSSTTRRRWRTHKSPCRSMVRHCHFLLVNLVHTTGLTQSRW